MMSSQKSTKESRSVWQNNTKILTGIALLWMYGMLFGCATAHLEKVMVGDQLAEPQEFKMVEVTRAGKALETRLKLPLRPGDEIRTDSASIAMLKFKQGTEIFILPDSHVIYQNPSILVTIGDILANIKGKFRVETESAAVSPVGTFFRVNVQKKDKASFFIVEGNVRLESKEKLWQPAIIKPMEKGAIQGVKSPKKSPIKREEYNYIAKNSNQVERLLNRAEPKQLLNWVVGLSLDKAKKILTRDGFRVGSTVERITGKNPAGIILKQKPPAGKWVKPGLEVDLWIEAKTVKVPVLTGLHYNIAVEKVEGAQLRVGEENWEISGNQQANTITKQKPSGGKMVREGTAVDLWVEKEKGLSPEPPRDLRIER